MTATPDPADPPRIAAALDQIRRTFGHLPDTFRILAEHAPEAFLGYARMREFVFRAPPVGHLEIWTKELLFVLLDLQIGNVRSAKVHLGAALRAGLTIGQLIEGLVQLIMVSGITTWNMGGREVLEHAIELAGEKPGPAPGGRVGPPNSA